MPEKRNRPMDSIFQSRPVKFVIGQDKKQYFVHQEAFASLSVLVRAIFANGMQVSLEAEVVWEDVDTETFDCLLQFAYNGEYNGSIGLDTRAKVTARDSISVSVDAASRKVSKSHCDAESLMDRIKKPRVRPRETPLYQFCTRNFCGHLNAEELDEAYRIWKRDMEKEDRQQIANYFMKHAKIFIMADKYSFDSLKEASTDIIRQALLFTPLTAELMDALIDTFCFVNDNMISEDGVRMLFVRYFIAQMNWITRNDYLAGLLQSTPQMAYELLTQIPWSIYDQLTVAVSDD